MNVALFLCQNAHNKQTTQTERILDLGAEICKHCQQVFDQRVLRNLAS